MKVLKLYQIIVFSRILHSPSKYNSLLAVTGAKALSRNEEALLYPSSHPVGPLGPTGPSLESSNLKSSLVSTESSLEISNKICNKIKVLRIKNLI